MITITIISIYYKPMNVFVAERWLCC